MATILDQLADYARCRVDCRKKELPLEERSREAWPCQRIRITATGYPFLKEGRWPGQGSASSARCKKRLLPRARSRRISPTSPLPRSLVPKRIGCIRPDGAQTNGFWERTGSCREIAEQSVSPALRKDFSRVDPATDLEAKLPGGVGGPADRAIPDDAAGPGIHGDGPYVGLSALVEAHDETEVRRAPASGAGSSASNERDLHTFTVDLQNSVRVRPAGPGGWDLRLRERDPDRGGCGCPLPERHKRCADWGDPDAESGQGGGAGEAGKSVQGIEHNRDAAKSQG